MKASFCTIDELKADGRYSCVGGPFGSDLTQRDYREEGVPVFRDRCVRPHVSKKSHRCRR